MLNSLGFGLEVQYRVAGERWLKALCPVPALDRSDGVHFSSSWVKPTHGECVAGGGGQVKGERSARGRIDEVFSPRFSQTNAGAREGGVR